MDIIYCLFSTVSFPSRFFNLTTPMNVYAEVAATLVSKMCSVFSILILSDLGLNYI